MTGWVLLELAAGVVLLVTASAVITRPAYRAQRVLLGMAAAAWVVGLVGILDGLNRT